MSESAHELLTREELDAILASVREEERGEEHGSGRRPASSLRSMTLLRPMRSFGDEQGRTLSTLHQRALTFSPLDFEEMSASDFAGMLIPHDLLAVIEFLPEREMGAILIGRSLAYGWLTMALGGPAGTPVVIPDRAYSPIEGRFLRGIANELARQLVSALRGLREVRIEVHDLVEPELVASALSGRLCVASFDALGFGDLSRLRVAFPEAWLEFLDRRGRSKDAGAGALVRERIMEMPLSLCAEVGTADLSVKRVAALCPGDVIPLDPVEGGSILVRLEDRPKFRAVSGAVGARLAVQVMEEV